jgi:hypothetical protein
MTLMPPTVRRVAVLAAVLIVGLIAVSQLATGRSDETAEAGPTPGDVSGVEGGGTTGSQLPGGDNGANEQDGGQAGGSGSGGSGSGGSGGSGSGNAGGGGAGVASSTSSSSTAAPTTPLDGGATSTTSPPPTVPGPGSSGCRVTSGDTVTITLSDPMPGPDFCREIRLSQRLRVENGTGTRATVAIYQGSSDNIFETPELAPGGSFESESVGEAFSTGEWTLEVSAVSGWLGTLVVVGD